MKNSKKEVYKNLIEIHQKCGQGLSGLVCINSEETKTYLEELISEGLVKAIDTGGSIGHPMSNIFYVPTTGYCVWDNEKNGNTAALQYIRFYLGQLEFESEEMFERTQVDFLRSPDMMREYLDWLTLNKKELDIMMSISPIYVGEIDSNVIIIIKGGKLYENNEKVALCIEKYAKQISRLKEMLVLFTKLEKISILTEEQRKNKEEYITDINDYKSAICIFKEMNSDNNIQEELEKFEKSYEKA